MHLVMVRGKSKPRVVHRHITRAIKEAERLCVKENRRVFVYAVFNFCEIVDGKVTWGQAQGGEQK